MEYIEAPRGVGKILIINDDPGASQDISKWLTKMGYRYTFVGSDKEAEDILEKEHFDATIYGHEFLFYRKYLTPH